MADSPPNRFFIRQLLAAFALCAILRIPYPALNHYRRLNRNCEAFHIGFLRGRLWQ
jgi:hypothetical protein